MTRILHLATERTWRGGENQLLHLLKGSQGKGLDHHVVLPPGAMGEPKFAPYATLVTTTCSPPFHPAMLSAVLNHVRDFPVDLMHAHTSKAHSIGLWLKALGVKAPLIVHRRVETEISPWPWSRRKYLSPDVARYIAVSRKIAGDLIHGGVPENRVEVIPSAVDGARFEGLSRPNCHHALAQELKVGDVPFATVVAHVSKLKGVDTFIRAFAAFQKKHPQWHGLIVGDGDERAEMEGLSDSLGLRSHLHFLGFRSDVPALLAASEIMCLPSLWEGLGSSLLDAALAGATLVGSNVGGIPEVIIQGRTGLLFEASHVAGLAECLVTLAENPELQSRLRAAARQHVETTFSLKALVTQTLDLYGRLASQKA